MFFSVGIVVVTLLQLCTKVAGYNGTVDVTDRYVITVRSDTYLEQHLAHVRILHNEAQHLETTYYEGITHIYDHTAFKGYAGHFSPKTILELHNSSAILAIEKSQIWSAEIFVQQRDAGYGLALISHRRGHRGDYIYEASAGHGTYAYVVDSGINTSQEDFQGRAIVGHNALLWQGDEDAFGHGTHVAGIIGGQRFGVAKLCTLIAVKISELGRTDSPTLLAGYNWAVDDIIRKRRQAKAVVTVSYGARTSDAWIRAVDEAFRRGVTTVAAAGNSNAKASNMAAGGADGAICVAATDPFRERAPFSNWGIAVNIFAPGVDITSDWIGSDHATGTRSGTSIAAAYVAGLVLYQKSIRLLPDARTTMSYIMGSALRGVVGSTKGSANLFAYNGNGR